EGSRADVAFGILGPDVNAKVNGAPDVKSSGDAYYMPGLGYIKKQGALAYGFGVYAQGGMGTDYSGDSFMGNPGRQAVSPQLTNRSEVGVGRLILPLSYDVNPNLTVAGSLDFVWAGMDLKMAMSGNQFGDMVAGLGGSQKFGSASGSLVSGLSQAIMGGAVTGVNWAYFDFSNNSQFTGAATATGFAGKLGLVYKVNPQLTLGATYHSKTSLGDMDADSAKLSMSANVSAQNPWGMPAGTYTMPITGKISVRNFQWPETYGFGGAFKVNDQLMLAADYKRIGWAKVMRDFKMTFTADNSAGNMALGFAGTSLDATLYQNWKDQDVFMLGASYKANNELTLRAGVNLANNPIPDTYVNALFPAIVKSHYMLGAGYAFNKASSADFAYSYAPRVSVAAGSTVESQHAQQNWQFMYSYRF
ncbi:MAG: outer membrane protein transport protein, partial [Rhodoferax sp.]|nr:outer membrane protein transport protein [Rhodoferax sp.]